MIFFRCVENIDYSNQFAVTFVVNTNVVVSFPERALYIFIVSYKCFYGHIVDIAAVKFKANTKGTMDVGGFGVGVVTIQIG